MGNMIMGSLHHNTNTSRFILHLMSDNANLGLAVSTVAWQVST